jgi:hypothetical protein
VRLPPFGVEAGARLREIVIAVGADPAIERILVFYDQASHIAASEQSWAAVRRGLALGAAECAVPVMVASTLPELLDEEAALTFIEASIAAVAGLRTGVACAAAGIVLPVACLSELGGRVALELSAPSLRHKADIGAVAVDLGTEEDVRDAHRRLLALGVEGARVLVERMASPGAELLVAARADAVVPCLVIAIGGIWTEALDDAAVVPLPAEPGQVEEAILGLRAAGALTGSHGGVIFDVASAASLAAAAGETAARAGASSCSSSTRCSSTSAAPWPWTRSRSCRRRLSVSGRRRRGPRRPRRGGRAPSGGRRGRRARGASARGRTCLVGASAERGGRRARRRVHPPGQHGDPELATASASPSGTRA